MALHDLALKDEYFIKRKLGPNVDFWYVIVHLPRVMCSVLNIMTRVGGKS